MKRISVLLGISLTMLVGLSSDGFCTVGGQVWGGGLELPCGSGGTLYTNQNAGSMNFALQVTSSSCTTTSLSWTDSQGHAQTITVGLTSAAVASSLPASGTISWSTASGGSGGVNFNWSLQRDQAVSLNMSIPCGATGVLYTNLGGTNVDLDLSDQQAYNGCNVTFYWTDGTGRRQTLAPGLGSSEGMTTSLPSGGTISYGSIGKGTGAYLFIEQAPNTP